MPIIAENNHTSCNYLNCLIAYRKSNNITEAYITDFFFCYVTNACVTYKDYFNIILNSQDIPTA